MTRRGKLLYFYFIFHHTQIPHNMFSVCVAADCNGEKVNIQFSFSFGPSISQLLERATEAFRVLFVQRHVQHPFTISASVIFNDSTCTWDRLERSTQLTHNSQVYIFQPDILDVPSEIGDPMPAGKLLGDYSSPPRDVPYPSPRPTVPATYESRPAFSHASPLHTTYTPITTSHQSYQHTSPYVDGAPNPYSLAYSSRYSSERSGTISDSSESIFRQERQKLERQSALPLDQMREELRREARDFSASPDRRSY